MISLAAQAATLCEALATKLETGAFDTANTDAFKTPEELTQMLMRLSEKKTDGYSLESVMSWLREARGESVTPADRASA